MRRRALIAYAVAAILGWTTSAVAQWYLTPNGQSMIDDTRDAIKVVISADDAGIGGGTQYAEDAAHVSGDVGTFSLTVRKDTAATTAGTDGDYAALITDASGRLWVNCGTGCSATQYAEDAVAASGDSGTLALVVRRDTASQAAGTDGDYTTLIADASGRLWVNCGTGCSGGTQYAVDDALGSTPTGTVALFTRDDALAALTPVEGDAVFGRVDGFGSIWHTLSDSAGARLLPAAAALSDTIGNPTTTMIGTALMGWDSGAAVWERIKTDAAGKLDIASSVQLPSALTASGNLKVAIVEDTVGSTVDTMDQSIAFSQATVALTATALYGYNGSVLLPVPVCDKTAVISTATSGNVELVAISGSTIVYVCAFQVTSVADVSVQFIKGTGTACATNEANLTGVYQLNASSGIRGISAGTGFGSLFRTVAGDAFCIELSGAVQIDGFISYAQY